MPNPTAAKPERTFCSTCGFPLRGSRCEACGSTQEPASNRDTGDDIPTKQTQFRPYAPDLDFDVSGLERAIEAFRNNDTPRFVEQLVVAEGGGTTRSAPTAEGPAWIATVRGGLVFVTLRPAGDEVVLEAPIAKLPSRQRLPALRLALELCARDAASSRVSLRGELLLLRFNARASLLTPSALRHYLREIGHLASRYAGLFMVGLDALPAVSDDQRATAGVDLLGRTKKVQFGAGGGVRRSMPPQAPPPIAPARQAPPPPRQARRDDDIPGMGEPPIPEAIPAVLSPNFGGKSPSAPPPPLENKRPVIPAPPPAPARPAPPPAAPPAPPPRSAQPEVELDAGSRRVDVPAASSGAPALSPSDRLCMLLRQAQSLASLTLEERPASMVWLVRSTVFRSVYDFKDTLPDAVAHLYRCTGVGKDPAGTRASQLNLPAAEPALLIMERVINARANMPKEKPLALEPMVSASQAKEHVARYLIEIDKAPGDSALRHFLALGALTELLVRTKLPPQTDQRLRDIVAHAQREGSKQQAIDLMMTALQRINS